MCACQARKPAGDAQKRERAEIPDVFFFGHHLANQAAGEAGDCRHRHGQPFMIQECRQADNRAAQRADHAAAKQAKDKRSLQHQIGKAVL